MLCFCSNIDKIREFIRNVYVDRRYAGAKSTDKPPRDAQAIYSWILIYFSETYFYA